MAIGTPQKIGSNSTSAAAATLTITTTVAVAAGEAILVAIANHNTAAVVPSSVTDSAGNTYTLITAPNSSAVSGTLAYAINATALASGQTITITFPSTRNAAAVASRVSGIATASAFDQSATNTTGSGTAASVGPTGTTTQADELVVGLFAYSNTHTFTAGSGYTGLDTVESTTTVRGVTTEYKIVAATGASSRASAATVTPCRESCVALAGPRPSLRQLQAAKQHKHVNPMARLGSIMSTNRRVSAREPFRTDRRARGVPAGDS